MSQWDWCFSKKNEPSQNLLDSFSDSKFNINCVASFTREIIQNSLDAKNEDIEDPVEIKFELKEVNASSIPGLGTLLEVLKSSIGEIKHNETKNKFSRAIEKLSLNKIEILKVSDYNTTGMSKNSWEALLFKEGISDKANDSSAGRHGVGKKASFLMSLCNTVFYATKNINGETYFSGKAVLVDWKNSENVWHSNTGWYGKKNNDNLDYLMGDDILAIDNYYTRNDKEGSDVIILAPRTVDDDNSLDRLIINSVLENFFIGLCENKIKVKVNSIEINSSNVESIVNQYYINKFNRSAINGSNIIYGLLNDFKTAYYENKNNPIRINVDKLNSYLDLYLTLNTEKTKKYFSFYRDHGMRIKDERYSDADKSFAAIVVARGKELNEFLLKLENAAHDDFIIDENLNEEEKKEQKNILKYIKEMIYHKISAETKMEVDDEIELEELNEMIDNLGEVSKKINKKIKKKTRSQELKAIIQSESNKKEEKEWRERIPPLDTIPIKKPTIPNSPPDPSAPHRPVIYPKEGDTSTNTSNKVLKEVSFEKMLITLHDCYYMQFSCSYDLKKVSIQVTAKNVDDALNEVNYMLDSIEWNKKVYESKGRNYIELGDLPRDEEMKLFIKLKESSRYKLTARIVGKTYE